MPMRFRANEVCAKFVKIRVIRGKKSFAAGEANPRKSALSVSSVFLLFSLSAK